MSLRIKKVCVCDGLGYTYDPRCRDKDCAHPSVKEVVSRDKDGNVLESTIMECPKRPCVCAAAAPYIEEIKDKIKDQEKAIAFAKKWGVWGSSG